MKLRMLITVAAVSGLLAACSTTGLDSKSTFNCKLGDTVDTGCKSISETYATIQDGGVTKNAPLANNGGIRRVPFSGMPVRTPEKVLRMWVAPWEDKDGDLRDQSYMFLTLRESRWQIAHNQESIINDYRPTIQLLGNGGEVKSKPATDADLPNLGIAPPKNRTLDPTPVMSPLDKKPNLIPPPTLAE